MAQQIRPGNSRAGVAVQGGYRLISVVDLCRVWLGYRQKRIRLYDLRVWFACQELCARRCALQDARPARYTLGELQQLVGGVGGEHLRRALRRLSVSELLHWSEERIDCSPAAGKIAPQDSTLSSMLEKIANYRRLVPVPRRMLRFLAGSSGRVLIATVLGHLLRCMYVRRGRCSTVGSCKAS